LLLNDGETGLFFRLFAYESEARQLRLMATAAHETGWHDGNSRRLAEVQAMTRECGPVALNGAAALLNSRKITEAEYLETVELVIRQLSRQAVWAAREASPRLIQGYLPYPDEFDHEWISLARSGQEKYADYRRWGYIALNRGMQTYSSLAGGGDWLLWASDHGMAEIRHSVSIAEVLARAGLDNEAILLYNAILVNTGDWQDGVVSQRRKAQVLKKVREELMKLRHPEDGTPVVREVLTSREGIPVCPTCADLYYDLAPGFRTNTRREPAVFKPVIPPEGAHGFAPERADMLAIFAARGPGIPEGSSITGMRTIDIASMISGLLGISPPRHSQGRQPQVEIRSTR
jgi:hypothetical protein